MHWDGREAACGLAQSLQLMQLKALWEARQDAAKLVLLCLLLAALGLSPLLLASKHAQQATLPGGRTLM